jgi:hypothetical protein
MTKQEFIDKAALRLIATDDAGAKWAYDHAEKLWEEREKRRLPKPTASEWVVGGDKATLSLYGTDELMLAVYPNVEQSKSYFVCVQSHHFTLCETEVSNVSLEDAMAEALLFGMVFVDTVEKAVGVRDGG